MAIKVNRVVGRHPSLGPIPASMLVPLFVAGIGSYLFYSIGSWLFGLGLLPACFFGVWLLASWWVVTGGGHNWRYISRFGRWFVPRWTRGGKRYRSWIHSHETQTRSRLSP